MLYRLLLLCVLLSFPGTCLLAQAQVAMVEHKPPSAKAAIVDSLWRLFDADDTTGMYCFLGRWVADTTRQIAPADSLRRILTEVFRLSFAEESYVYTHLPKAKYVVLKDWLCYVDCQSSSEWDMKRAKRETTGRIDTLRDYIPAYPNAAGPVLVLTRALDSALTCFLNGYRAFPQDRLYDCSSPAETRITFLRKTIRVIPSHFGDRYHFTAVPGYERIELSPDHCEAKVISWDTHSSGSVFVLNRSSNGWISARVDGERWEF